MNETLSVLSVGIVLTALVLYLVWRHRHGRTYPEGWVTPEEAERRTGRVQQKWAKVMEEQGGELSKEQSTQAMMELMEAERIGFVDCVGIHLTITMPLAIQPLDRCVQFETPLIEALGDLGTIHGGGSFMRGEEMEIAEVDIGVDVKNLDRGLAIIRECLMKQGAPSGTRIRQREPEKREFALFE